MNAETLARALGGKRAGRQWVARCPAHDDRTPSLIIYDGKTDVQVRCLAGCTPMEIIKVLAATGRWEVAENGVQLQPPPDDAEARRNSELAIAIWNEGVDPHGTLAEVYLWGRDLSLPTDCSGLRFHARCPRGGERGPALIAAMCPLKGHEPVAIQRIFFSADRAEKIAAMMLGPTSGCAMKLTEHYMTFSESLMFCPRLFVCEGLETGIALIERGYSPCWALGSAGAIERLPVLFGVGQLIICADHDPVGLRAAKVCAERWNATTHQEATIVTPEAEGHDYADPLEDAHA
jgi:putative DNA primase/helicase